jgi:hypothetical protein
MVACGAPRSRMRRVMARLSTPARPIRLCDFSQASKCWALRQFDGSVMSSRSTTPRTAGVVVSMSSGLVPTLPMCGKVKVMISPA